MLRIFGNLGCRRDRDRVVLVARDLGKT
jgi:hypothetical protein